MPERTMPSKNAAGCASSEGQIRLDYPALSFREATPLGNGRLGAMFFGGVSEERIVINESSLWSGSRQDADRHDAHLKLPEIRRLLLEGKNDRAEALVMENFICQGAGSGQGKGARLPFGCYQVLGNLHISFHQNDPSSSSHTGAPPCRRRHYIRMLDLDRAIMQMEYDLDATRFRREAIASFPAQAVVVRLSADRSGAVSLRAYLDRPERFTTMADGENGLLMTGQVDNGVDGQGVKYACRLRAVNLGGSLSTSRGVLEVSGADEVLIFICAATDAKTFAADGPEDPESACAAALSAAAARTWDSLVAEHVQDYQSYYRRVSLKLGPENAQATDRSTPERILAMQAGEEDPSLAALYFNFGRYLLISSSRPGGLPANLQGIWAEEIQTPWNGDWHLNAQQMNYWPAEVCDLSELHQPYLQLVESLQAPGARTARSYYGARGWMAHMITNPWGFTSPGEDARWGSSPLGSGWLCLHLWEHFQYSGDRNYLAWMYPILKGAALFYLDMLIEEPAHGWLVTAPSSSPENVFILPDGQQAAVCMGPAYDMQILRFLFGACIEAARLLDLDTDFQAELVEKRARLSPTRVGADGRVMEWLEDYAEALPYHRHTSHLWGLFPGDEITPQMPALAAAARETLEKRGFLTPGWGLAHRQCLWARLGDGEHAYDMLRQILTGSTFPNLFNRCYHAPETSEPVEMPDLWDSSHPFQIDGNLGAAAGIAEMLLHSHQGILRFLPALPSAWPSGKVYGLRARGGYSVDLEWDEGQLVEARVRSHLGRPCRVISTLPLKVCSSGADVETTAGLDGLLEFATQPGGEYRLTPGTA